MTDVEAAKIIALLQVAYPFPPLTNDRHQFYTEKIRPLDFAAATRALDLITDDPTIERFPTAATLKAAIQSEMGLKTRGAGTIVNIREPQYQQLAATSRAIQGDRRPKHLKEAAA